jgi:hypothetical protein
MSPSGNEGIHEEPERFTFDGRTARVATAAGSAQMVIDYFKSWLPTASNKLHQLLKMAAVESEQRQLAMLKKERETEELNLKTNNNLHV